MSGVVKVIELIAESDQGWEEAARNAVREAAKTVKGLKSIWIDNMTATVQGDRIASYRVNAKISFVVEASR